MKRILTAGLIVLAAIAGAAAGDAVEPATVAMDCTRGVAGASITGRYYRGTTLLWTNCQTFSDSAGSVTQGLTDVEVELRIGTTSSSTAYTATVYDAASGYWACSTTVPSNSEVNIQVKLTDENTNIYIYPLSSLSTREALD